jgi:GNAT superfamily N-acetyltransferase
VERDVVTSIRPGLAADARAIASIQVATWRTTYGGILDRDFLAGLSRRERARQWRETLTAPARGEFVLLAETEGRPVAFIAGGPEREADPQYQGEIYAIYVLRRKQFRGVGRALFLAAADNLLLQGMRSLLVWVLAANPYRRFYESLGGQPVRSRSLKIGGRRLEETGYGWEDIKPLVPPFILPLP